MVNVTLRNGLDLKVVPADPIMTIREFLDSNGVNYSTATPALDGTPLRAGELDKSFDAYGITDSCRLSCIEKTSNA